MSDEIRNDSTEQKNDVQTNEQASFDSSSQSPSANNNYTPASNIGQNTQPQQTPPTYNTSYYSSQNPNGYQGGMYSGSMYSAPANQYGYQNSQAYQAPNPQQMQTNAKKQKNHGAGLAFCCIVLSIIFGLGGAVGGLFVYNRWISPIFAPKEEAVAGGNTVIYEAIDKEIPESVSKAGTVASVANVALPSVVEITTEAVVNNSFYGQYVTQGAGSGVIISSDGYIVTNNHVVSGASNITVRLSNGDEFKATLIGTDAQTDIGVIKIDAKNLTPAVFGDSSKLIIGELTVAIGNPLGHLGGTVTDGIISALDREITVEGENMVLLQTNAAVSPGNSGGGLFNANGELIGIVNAKSSGDSIEGLGFAIPANTAKPIIKDLIEKGHVTGRPSIGISIIEVTTDYQKYMYGVSDYGVYIQSSENDNLKSGDRMVAIDGNSVSSSSDIKAIINNHKVGDKLTITVFRKGKIVDVEITLVDSASLNKG